MKDNAHKMVARQDTINGKDKMILWHYNDFDNY